MSCAHGWVGANTTPLVVLDFSAAYFAKRNLNGGDFEKGISETRPHSSSDPSCGRDISRGFANHFPQKNSLAKPSQFLEFSIKIFLIKSSDFIQEGQRFA